MRIRHLKKRRRRSSKAWHVQQRRPRIDGTNPLSTLGAWRASFAADRNSRANPGEAMKNDMPEELKRIGKYVVMEILGRGGMGCVYRALSNQLCREGGIRTRTKGIAEDPEQL